MRLHHTSAPGYPTRGLFRPVPMAPAGDEGEGAGGSGSEDKKADEKKPDSSEKPDDKGDETPDEKDDPKPEPKPEPKKEPAKPEPAKPEPKRKVDELERKVEQRLQALDERLEKQRQKAVLSELRRLGADPELVSDADLLQLAPKVDPDEPAGAKALLEFKKARARWFAAEAPAPQEQITNFAKTQKERGLSKDKVEARARLAAKLGGKR